MEKYVQDIRLKQWCELIEAANSSGLPRKQWLKDNGISKDAFYYWQRKVRRYYAEQNGMDIMTLAFKSNIQPNTLKRIEAGKFSADLDILTQIAQGMGMKIDFVELKNEESHESISDVRS